MSEEKPVLNLSARHIIVWLAAIVGITVSTLMATSNYVFDTSALSVAVLWVVRILTLASFWLLKLPKDVKIFGIGLIALSLVLDLLLKLPVLGSVQYADWFLVSALDITGTYSVYFTVWGLLLPVITMTGWFVLARRKLAGWITGLILTVAMGFLAFSAASSDTGTFTVFMIFAVARYIVPAAAAALVDFILQRFQAKSATN
ncbi:hypothetical protein AUR04nite_27640 [Glutamicibacter uratoxydans]|uniref:Uncharacterized protein n=1 Tax=Glutamicibacter uratoxydans TaxID=43667 RepID=A0A4Y4DPH0_GLUUR|nr:hypothetical protein [Glutamicibacter uratoxydans]GED07232.1 hypothetical protein AUR04nite_27640 [Glutamicibacter uratoxydans]